MTTTTSRTARAQLVLRVYNDDREPFEVTVRLIDHNTWDITRARHKWPTTEEAPMTWLGFLAWAAARRTGEIPGDYTWETFLAHNIAVENTSNDDETGPDLVGPTETVPGRD